ncbi:MAG: leucine-rich repeat domain-containing protein [Chitinophagales bacterium]|nr:leucine-rich repeat domain-containing protein [Chitinophagales bacterium]
MRLQTVITGFSLFVMLHLSAQKEFTSLDDALKAPEAVKILNLSGKGLTAVPASVTKFVNLEKLNLSNNKIAAFPKELSALKKLKTLNLTANAFTSFPIAVTSITSLEDFEISFNNITAIPKELTALAKLKRVSASKCGLKNLPAELGKMQTVEIIDLSYNDFTSIPTQLTGMKNLKTLDLSFNKNLSAFPSEIKDLAQLRFLNLKSAKITAAQVNDELSWLIPNCQIMQ